ncbi:MAG: hypothetical protein A3G34_06990 [Candidatus Lindowbacteria bacterium RIFCSPLOWO2_12_FULL_62_27]|nr:MAG: hypothetical protein A3G34_06990 [Candidatus Lindowbacteria bacterium RIFCSPLOWO2_12_FULL_62_27]OGH61289.1 MAG: hypothetical protein A3I06_03395 [Candidatus Lindowbacteria bacterium RIFCSPLOWO2_02_FULL_62_12]
MNRTRPWIALVLLCVLAGPARAKQESQEAFLLGRLYIDTKRYREAAELLDRAVKEDPANAVLLIDLAYAYQRLGHWDRTLELYGKVLQIDPKHEDVRKLYTQLKYQYGRRLAYDLSLRRFAAQDRAAHDVEAYLPLQDRTYIRLATGLRQYKHAESFLKQSVHPRANAWQVEWGRVHGWPFDFKLWAGLGEAYSDSDGRVSIGTTLVYRPDEIRDYRLDAVLGKLWDDPVEAYLANGYYDAYRGSTTQIISQSANQILNWSAAFEYREYKIHKTRSFGPGRIYEMTVGYRAFRTVADPSGHAGYAGGYLGYYGIRNSPKDEYVSVVALAKTINQIGLHLNAGRHFSKRYFAEADVFSAHDNSRNIDLFSFESYGYRVQLFAHVDAATLLESAYEMASESSVTGTGKTRLFQAKVTHYF